MTRLLYWRYCIFNNFVGYAVERDWRKKKKTIIIIIIRKKYFEKRRENLLIMQLVIHLNRRDVVNVIGATSINSQDVFDASLKNFAQIKTKLNMKMGKIKRLYESKEKNLSKMMSWIIMIKFFDLMKHATRHECADVTKTTSECFEKQVTRLKKMIRKLKRMIEKTKNTMKENTWAKITIKQSAIAISTFFLREINVFSKRKSSRKMKLMT